MVASNRKVIYELDVTYSKDARSKLEEFGNLAVKQQDRIAAAATQSAQARQQTEAQTASKIQALAEKAAAGQKGWYQQLSQLDKSAADQVFANRSKLMARIAGLDAKRTKDVEKQYEQEAEAADKFVETQTRAQEKVDKARERSAEKATEAEAKAHEKQERAEKHAERERKKALHEITEVIEEAGRAMVLLNVATEEDVEKSLKLWASFEGGLKLIHAANKGILAGSKAWDAWHKAATAATAAQAGGAAASAGGGAISLSGGVAGLATMFNPISAAVGVAAIAMGGFALACKHEADVIAEATKKREEAQEKLLDKIKEDREKAAAERDVDAELQASRRREGAMSAGMGRPDGLYGPGAGTSQTTRGEAEAVATEKSARAEQAMLAAKREKAEEDAAWRRNAADTKLRNSGHEFKSKLEQGPEGDIARNEHQAAQETAEKQADAAIAFGKQELELQKQIADEHQKARDLQLERIKKEQEAQLKAIDVAKDQLQLSLRTRDSLKQAVDELQKQHNTRAVSEASKSLEDQTKYINALSAAKKASQAGNLGTLTQDQLKAVAGGDSVYKTKAEDELKKRFKASYEKAGLSEDEVFDSKDLVAKQKELAAATSDVTAAYQKLAKTISAAGGDPLKLPKLDGLTAGKFEKFDLNAEVKTAITVKFEMANTRFADETKRWMQGHEQELRELIGRIYRLETEQKERSSERDKQNAARRAAGQGAA